MNAAGAVAARTHHKLTASRGCAARPADTVGRRSSLAGCSASHRVVTAAFAHPVTVGIVVAVALGGGLAATFAIHVRFPAALLAASHVLGLLLAVTLLGHLVSFVHAFAAGLVAVHFLAAGSLLVAFVHGRILL